MAVSEARRQEVRDKVKAKVKDRLKAAKPKVRAAIDAKKDLIKKKRKR